MITPDTLRAFAPRCDAASLALPLQSACVAQGITTAARVCVFMGQVFVESTGLTRFEENLHYTAEVLKKGFPARFPTLDLATQAAAKGPVVIAGRLYGDRLGNHGPADGWTYRGRGLIQITGRANYAVASKWTAVDLIAHPDRAAEPEIAAVIAAAFFASKGCIPLADAGDIEGVTKKINGGLNGLAERQAATIHARSIWA